MAERHTTTVQVEGAQVPVVADCDVVVIGAGPAGHAAAVSAARNGASVTLLERYHHLGGMASGGMVLVLDDMVNEGNEIVTTGIVSEFVDRLATIVGELRDAAREQDWSIHWEQVDAYCRAADEAAEKNANEQAVREYARAMSFMMKQIREEREKKKASDSSITL